MKETIKIFTNLVEGGWSAHQLESGIGGSEEKLIEFAQEMAKEFDVIIYMNGVHGLINNVKYEDHRNYKPWEYCDVFISFKNKNILLESINASKIFHWTTEIEPEWTKTMLNDINNVICISDYHVSRMKPKSDKFKTMYLWADLSKLNTNNIILEMERLSKVKDIRYDISPFPNNKEKDSMLYSSSFDRGLEELLMNWKLVQEELGVKKLYITYGWDFIDKMIKYNPQLIGWKNKMLELIKQEGVELVGKIKNDEMCKMYWKCEYWVLPLSNPDSELFCINAIKAQYCECIPIVRKIGALQETVNNCLNWDGEILGRPNQKSNWNKNSIEKNKKFAEKFSLDLKIKEWKKLIEK